MLGKAQHAHAFYRHTGMAPAWSRAGTQPLPMHRPSPGCSFVRRHGDMVGGKEGITEGMRMLVARLEATSDASYPASAPLLFGLW